MRPEAAALAVTLQTDAYAALEKMQRTGVSRLPVVDDLGQLVGIVTLKDLLRFLRLKLELEGAAELEEGPRPAAGPGALPARPQGPSGARAA
jgi:signal-transduction protein with cAMP-binding, CBS, and nucleotidyltransferase domain